MMTNLINSTKGRTLTIKQKGSSVINKTLYIEGGIDLKVDSDYKSLWNASSNSLMNLVSSSFTFGGKALPSGQFPMQGIQIWESTNPLSFSITANLYMETSGYEDVVKPSLTLMGLTAPTKSNAFINDNVEGKHNLKIKTLIPPGPNIQAIMESIKGDGNTDSADMGSLKDSKSKGVFTIEIADYMTIDKVIVKGVDVKFSHILDEKKCPVSAEISLDFMTMEVATTDMLMSICKSSKGV